MSCQHAVHYFSHIKYTPSVIVENKPWWKFWRKPRVTIVGPHYVRDAFVAASHCRECADVVLLKSNDGVCWVAL